MPPKRIDEYKTVSEFLSSCKSKYTAKGYKTILDKFFNFCIYRNVGFDPEVVIKLEEALNAIVLNM